jgi:CHAD domain-containing protein
LVTERNRITTRRRRHVTTALLDPPVRALRRQLPLAIEGDDTGVHQARVASRRLRETVPVLAGELKGSKAGKAVRKLRKLTRALGSVRELDVSTALIAELAARDNLNRAALQDVRLHVEEERKARRAAMLEQLRDVDAAKLERRLGSVRRSLLASETLTWRQRLAARLLKRAKRLAVQVDAAGPLYAPEHLHQVRIAVKKLRYGLELAGESGVAPARAAVRELKRAQENLGRLHDLQVLQTYVARAQLLATGRQPLHEALAAIAGRIEEECRVLHGRYVAAAPRLREVAATVRSEIVPRLTLRTRPLKMSLRRARKAAASV